jgi:hypothetical protein
MSFRVDRNVSAAVSTRGVPAPTRTTEVIDMTTHESFKRRIRERMALTGERYTAARRALLDAAAQRGGTRTWVSEPELGDDALRKATGRGWDAWCDIVDAWPGKDQGHTAVAAYLASSHGVDGWWAQGVTVGWERITGRRLPYQMADGSFTAGRSKTIDVDAAALRAALLDGEERGGLFPGHATELRSKPASKTIRVLIGPGTATFTLDAARDGRTKVTVAHEKLPSSQSADEWRFYWGEWLEAVDGADRADRA